MSREKAFIIAATAYVFGALSCMGCSNLLLYVGKAEPGAQAPWAPSPASEPGRHAVSVISTERIVPGPRLPQGTVTLKSNNNLAVTRHEGRVWLAWRTASTHFATDTAMIQVMSSADEKAWRLEHRIALGTDVREPQFLSIDGRLMLYFSMLGKNSLAFEPKGMYGVERRSDGSWSNPYAMGLGDVIGWRIRNESGVPYLVAYDNGVSLYKIGGDPLKVLLLTTEDGFQWKPALEDRPVIHVGGGSETDFTFAEDGTLYAVMRNEFGERGRYGSLVCTAPRGKMGEWSCLDDPRKFDSPHVFAHDGEVYLVARRNVTPSGRFERPVLMRSIRNHLDYIIKGKRCALWRFAEGGKRIAFVLDLPSRGDTCFPSVLKNADGTVTVYDYSSDIHGPDSPWSVGQRSPTFIYRHVLSFTRR